MARSPRTLPSQNPGGLVPDDVSKQTGFEGGRAPLLDELDSLFYAADKAAPMINQSARWIASWPELRAVDDADYPEAIRRVRQVMSQPLPASATVASLSRHRNRAGHHP